MTLKEINFLNKLTDEQNNTIQDSMPFLSNESNFIANCFNTIRKIVGTDFQ